MEYLLSTDSLTKRYGRHKAVNSVNIHIRQGRHLRSDRPQRSGKDYSAEDDQRACVADGRRVYSVRKAEKERIPISVPCGKL